MTEIMWFMFVVWLAFFVLSFKIKDIILPGAGGVVGFLLAFSFFSEKETIGLIFLILAIYQLYLAVFSGEYN